MNLILFYLKELYFKFILFILLSITITSLIIYNIKYIFLYILSPLKAIKINNFLIEYNINIPSSTFINEVTHNTFIPIIEMNLPFFTTSYIYIKYIVILILYLILPLFLYFIYISTSSVLKNKEYFYLTFNSIYYLLFIFFNFMINHYIIIPFFIQFIYSHYKEFELYEFDIEFQILTYLDFYFFLLFFNLFFFIIINKKKNFTNKHNVVIIYIIPLLFLPTDLSIQLIYILWISLFNIISNINTNYIILIKKYKQTGCLEKK